MSKLSSSLAPFTKIDGATPLKEEDKGRNASFLNKNETETCDKLQFSE